MSDLLCNPMCLIFSIYKHSEKGRRSMAQRDNASGTAFSVPIEFEYAQGEALRGSDKGDSPQGPLTPTNHRVPPTSLCLALPSAHWTDGDTATERRALLRSNGEQDSCLSS